MPTKEELQKRVQELEEENDQLQDQLDQIYDIVAPPEGEAELDRDRVTAQRETNAAAVPQGKVSSDPRRYERC